MIRIQLPAAEAERLDARFRSTEDRKLRDRLQIVLMAHRGRARQDIATDRGVRRKTLQPAVEPDGAVVAEAASASDAQPPVRHPGRPEQRDPGRPEILPNP